MEGKQRRAMRNAISVDIEDYFHPSEVLRSSVGASWEELPSRVTESTRRVLALFSRHRVKGTFFILGWVADRNPELIREIAAEGHEIGCHSYLHRLVYELTPAEFAADTMQAVEAIERACGIRPVCYRAPSYSITRRSLWAWRILAECGFTHDSSVYPIVHDRYGIPDFPLSPQRIETGAGPLIEIPVATIQLGTARAPVGGGGYLRLLPYRYTAAGLRRIERDTAQPACLYFHPWEIDDGQPRIAGGLIARMRTYLGLRAMESKLERLLTEFEFGPLGEVYRDVPVEAVWHEC